nr:MAG TPA: hypothetical protein [Caudoviricetes sp.]
MIATHRDTIGTTGLEPVTSQFLKLGFNPSTIYPLTSMRLLL